jgi:8-oxo-dGTP pyrophosphatase MutT (NUDIX family)
LPRALSASERYEGDYLKNNGSLRDSAVLVPVFRSGNGGIKMVLVRRTEFGVHGGQLAFPGGKHGPGDSTMLETALREAEEEVYLATDAVVVLAELPVVDTATTGYRIFPFLARIRPPDRWRYQEREVTEVLEVAVEELADPGAHEESVERFPEWPDPIRIPFYKVGPYRLWGATYRIVTPLIPRLLNGEWEI